MNKLLRTITKQILLLGTFLVLTVAATAQLYQGGLQKGVIKVKFKSTMTSTLERMPAQARANRLLTGISSFDAAAERASASNMQRMFPFDPRYENKLRKHGLHLWYIIEINQDINPEKAVQQFKSLGEVDAVEGVREKVLSPYSVEPYTPGPAPFNAQPFNDPMLADQWHYNNTGQSGFSDADVNLFEAWITTTGSKDVIVAVHDEGVDVNHADLKANLWINEAEQNGVPNVDDDGNGYVDDIHGYNFSRDRGALDPQFHGTHVAGTIAAVNNNGVGVAGVAGGNGSGNGARIMSLQIFGGASVEETYVYAANNGAVISQNSWGYSSPGSLEQSVLDAINYFIAEAGDYAGSPMKGGVVIFAAGNSNSEGEFYPGYYHGTLAVSSLGPEWKRAYYSNYGEWVDVSAPGGDLEYNSKSGVLSTIPNNKYAYMQGTSMACPHVSGIAALALANRTRQLTNVELWNKIVTGVVDINQYNEEYNDKLGSGAIDAALAIRNDQGVAPDAITDLAVTGIAQEFATLQWSVPSDEDDSRPVEFTLYYHTQPLSAGNLASASKVRIKNAQEPGTEFSYELNGLLGLTTYHLAVQSTDRWGNVSALSNLVIQTTNNGPSIAVDENSESIELLVDAGTSMTTTHDITILNKASGILRWGHFMRHTNTSLPFNAAGINYPKVLKKGATTRHVGKKNVRDGSRILRSSEPEAMAFTQVEKSLSDWPTNIVGETDLSLTNSAAAKFMVTEAEGFNLTQVRMYLKHDPDLGPVVMEIFKGALPEKSNLIHAQEHNNWGADESWAYITLPEQLYFQAGDTFWVVFHVPAGNKFPLGIGFETTPVDSENCFFSWDLGSSWTPLELALDSRDFAWSMAAVSENAHLGTYLTLEPGSGDVEGNSHIVSTLTANASELVNGTYTANLVLASNDAQNRELRIPVTLTVGGHLPDVRYIDIANFGGVFVGTEKMLELALENKGYGNFDNLQFSFDGTDFEIDNSAPWQIKAREEAIVRIKFKPSATGNINDVLTITDGTQTYKIMMFGVGAEASTISISPITQTIDDISIGDVVTAQVNVENTGAYPLKYFIPGFDEKGVSQDWPTPYHGYGYKFRSNFNTEADPIAYEFQDISTTGTNISSSIKWDTYYTLDMGFEFPFYGDRMSTIYIAQNGFTTFDNSIRPINVPTIPGNEYSPKGYISPIGTYLSYVAQGQIFSKVEADRVIIQYDNVNDGWNPASITAQMVLYANGNIRFFYEDMGLLGEEQNWLNILIEDMNHTDGILLHGWEKRLELFSGLVLGLDYPGPSIITSVENGSGVIAPGASAVVDITMNTGTLAEGSVNRYVNFISNDPMHAETSALIQLEITDGGVPMPEVSVEEITFGDVFQGAVRSSNILIKNPGNADVNITGVAFSDGEFTVAGDAPTVIRPGLYKKYVVTIPTDVIASLDDVLTVSYSDGTNDVVHVTGNVVPPPAIDVDLSTLQESLAFGETSSHPLTIGNTGAAPLEVVVSGQQWVSFDAPSAAASFDYTVRKHNNDDIYQWIEIRSPDTQLPFLDFDDFDNSFWRALALPFPIEFYGVSYSSFKIGDNGLIAFEESPPASLFTDFIPSSQFSGPCIMPYWTFSGFTDIIYAQKDIGIFYKAYEDKFIITWSYFSNNFGGMGDPVSAQAIFYKNGTIKFQYKQEEGGNDLTSQFSVIGVQKDATTGIAISEYLPLDFGAGLAYVLVPAKKQVIAPGETLAGNINFNAENIYGGTYTSSVEIRTNVPGSEQLEKPVELTVTGEAILDAGDEIDFGGKMILLESGSPVKHYADFIVGNKGSVAVEITYAQLADGTQGLSLEVWALMDGFFGRQWRWADISELYSPWSPETPVFKLKPGDQLKTRASFAPAAAGEFMDELLLTTSTGEKRVTLKGAAYEPPVIAATTDSIRVFMNLPTETATRTVPFDNIEGLSDLEYEVSIRYGRIATGAAKAEPTSDAGPGLLRRQAAKTEDNVIRPMSGYNRVINHTQKTAPDTYVGTGGTAPFTLATKYNAGPDGFNVSHVETWFRPETQNEGTISVEIRAGGNSIESAAILAEGSVTFTNADEGNTGEWLKVAMDHVAGIYPNEDFYVVVTYPLGIEYPQGTIEGDQAAGRYYYFDMGSWYDVQKERDFETMGWLMFAAEETPSDISWLTIKSDISGIISLGGQAEVELLLKGATANRGGQIAHVVIKSNDPENPEVLIPVSLHVNKAPEFVNAPLNNFVAENDTLLIDIAVVDEEGNNFSVTLDQTHKGVTHSFSNGVLHLVVMPAYGDAGNYQYKIKATDEHDASSETTLLVEVAHTNRAPQFIGSEEAMQFYATGTMNEHSIEDYFSDPDGDAFEFSVRSSNPETVAAFASTNQFLVRPLKAGESYLVFRTTDTHGAVSIDSITVEVMLVLGAEQPFRNNGMGIYPVPAEEMATVTFSHDWKEQVTLEIVNTSGTIALQQIADIDSKGEVILDVSKLTSGLYVVKAVSGSKRGTIKLIKK